jgi:hypothetical protein
MQIEDGESRIALEGHGGAKLQSFSICFFRLEDIEA